MADLFKAKKISCSSQCEKCLNDCGIEIECECGGDDDCELCNGFGKRKPTEEELATRDMERLWIMTIMGLIDD